MQIIHRYVVVDEHVGPGPQHPLQPAHQNRQGRLIAQPLGGDEHRLTGQDRLAEDLQTGRPQRRARLDDVGDEIGHAQLHRGLHRAVEVDDPRTHTPTRQVIAHQHVVGGGHAPALHIRQRPDRPRGRGEAEGGPGEAQRQMLHRIDPRVQQQIPTRDTGVNSALPHVDGDIARTQEEQLHTARLVDQDQLAPGAPGAITGLGEQGDGGLGQGTLIGHGNAQHDALLHMTTDDS